jgi:hypothetical protein
MNRALDKSWFDKAIEQLQLSESLISGGVDNVYRGWKASAQVIGKLCTGADRWHAALREMQATVNLADILRARTAS